MNSSASWAVEILDDSKNSSYYMLKTRVCLREISCFCYLDRFLPIICQYFKMRFLSCTYPHKMVDIWRLVKVGWNGPWTPQPTHWTHVAPLTHSKLCLIRIKQLIQRDKSQVSDRAGNRTGLPCTQFLRFCLKTSTTLSFLHTDLSAIH